MTDGKLKGVFEKATKKGETLLKSDLLEALEESNSTIASVTDCMMSAKGLVSYGATCETRYIEYFKLIRELC